MVLFAEGRVTSIFQNACRDPMFSILIINNCQEVTDFIQAGPSLEITSSVIDKQYCCLIIDIGFTLHQDG